MDRREKLKKIVNVVCSLGIILSNIGLVLSSILMFRGIVTKQADIIIFTVQVFVLFMITLQLSKYFKNYLD